jgi:hypothetical protein
MDAADRMHCDRLHADISVETCLARRGNSIKYTGSPTGKSFRKIVDPFCGSCAQGEEVAAAAEGKRPKGNQKQKGAKQMGRGRPKVDNVSAKPDDPRTCKECEAVKKAADFYRKKSTRDGYDIVCKVCRRAQQKEADKARRADAKASQPPPAPAEKRCTLCGLVQPISEFHKRIGSPDGHRSQCKRCRNEEESSRKMEERGRVIIDFTKHPVLYDILRALAEVEYRRPDQQILWLLANHPQFKEEMADGQ